ncbi:hypothetical protein [Enterobacter cloacae]|uniref:hypothetical protein n=1 Tax=Enterobacter cloacae TaxID=550 RepID=UPI00388F89AC
MWGKEDGNTLRGSYRNLVVLGSAQSDEETAAKHALSRSLGDIDVVRNKNSKTSAGKGNSETNGDHAERTDL